MPSGLPSAFDMGSALADFFASERKIANVLKELMRPVKKGTGISVKLRFERTLQVVRDTADRELKILLSLDSAKKPTALHHFLAGMLMQGAPVFTTNFDCLIERAYLHEKPTGPLTIIDRERGTARCRRSSFSFALSQKVFRPPRRHFLYKLHGSLHQLRTTGTGLQRIGNWQTETVGATLDRIGRDSVAARMEINKEKVLWRELRGRTLVVVGYSGLDDFDVVPALERAIRKHCIAGMVWIFHDNVANIALRSWVTSGRYKLPGILTPVIRASGTKAYVIAGKTVEVISALFSHWSGSRNPATAIPDFDPKTVMRHQPYKNLSLAARRFTAGRLCESAGDFSHADLLYRKCLAAAGFNGHDSLRIRGSALARRGYIAWVRGDNRRALRLLNAALDLMKRSHICESIASVTNQIGFVHMSRGELDQALTQYKEALRFFRKLKNRASIAKALTNIGIIHRRRGEFRKAESLFKRALATSTAIRDRDGMARDLGNLANAYGGQKKYGLALRNAQKAFKLAEQVGQGQIMAVQAGNIGVYQRRLGHLSDALVSQKQALALNRKLGRSEGVHDAMSNIGAIVGEQRKYTKSVRYLDRAISRAKKLGDIEGLAEDFEMRADVMARWGKSEAALKDWQKSARYFGRLGNQTRAAEVKSKTVRQERGLKR